MPFCHRQHNQKLSHYFLNDIWIYSYVTIQLMSLVHFYVRLFFFCKSKNYLITLDIIPLVSTYGLSIITSGLFSCKQSLIWIFTISIIWMLFLFILWMRGYSLLSFTFRSCILSVLVKVKAIFTRFSFLFPPFNRHLYSELQTRYTLLVKKSHMS